MQGGARNLHPWRLFGTLGSAGRKKISGDDGSSLLIGRRPTFLSANLPCFMIWGWAQADLWLYKNNLLTVTCDAPHACHIKGGLRVKSAHFFSNLKMIHLAHR